RAIPANEKTERHSDADRDQKPRERAPSAREEMRGKLARSGHLGKRTHHHGKRRKKRGIHPPKARQDLPQGKKDDDRDAVAKEPWQGRGKISGSRTNRQHAYG